MGWGVSSLLAGWSTKQIEIGKFVLMEIFSTLNYLLCNMNACYMNTNYRLIRLYLNTNYRM